MLRKNNNTNRSFDISISENAEQLILGSILGDGCVSKHGRYENSKLNRNSQLRMTHGICQKEYCLYKKSLFEKEGIKMVINERYYEREPHFIKGHLVINNGSIVLETRKAITLNKYRDLFYNDKKFVNEYIYKLKPLGLAIWFMDDGNKHQSGYYISTDGFTYTDQMILSDMMLKNFNINVRFHKTRDTYKMYIPNSEVNKFNN